MHGKKTRPYIKQTKKNMSSNHQKYVSKTSKTKTRPYKRVTKNLYRLNKKVIQKTQMRKGNKIIFWSKKELEVLNHGIRNSWTNEAIANQLPGRDTKAVANKKCNNNRSAGKTKQTRKRNYNSMNDSTSAKKKNNYFFNGVDRKVLMAVERQKNRDGTGISNGTFSNRSNSRSNSRSSFNSRPNSRPNSRTNSRPNSRSGFNGTTRSSSSTSSTENETFLFYPPYTNSAEIKKLLKTLFEPSYIPLEGDPKMKEIIPTMVKRRGSIASILLSNDVELHRCTNAIKSVIQSMKPYDSSNELFASSVLYWKENSKLDQILIDISEMNGKTPQKKKKERSNAKMEVVVIFLYFSSFNY